MHSCCDILCQSLEDRRAWDAFILLSEQGVEILEEIVQVEERCLIWAEGRISH